MKKNTFNPWSTRRTLNGASTAKSNAHAKLLVKEEREAHIAALHRMQEAPAEGVEHEADARALDAVARRKGKRPLKPPPGQLPERMSRAGEIDARKAREKGPQHAFTFGRGRR